MILANLSFKRTRIPSKSLRQQRIMSWRQLVKVNLVVVLPIKQEIVGIRQDKKHRFLKNTEDIVE